ncbi:MAG: adenine deaminase [bacterium]
MSLKHRIDVAAGRASADLLLQNARIVSVFADRIFSGSVAIADGVIAGFGDYRARRKIDLKGGYLSSGLIDSHLHIESTLLAPSEFARCVVPRGTTSVVADPHEIANVLGSKGIRWMLSASEGLPLDIYIVLPSCVPASHFESAAQKLGAPELRKLANLPRVIGMGEVMDFPGVIAGREDLLAKIRLIPGMRVDGHAPGLSGKELYAYIAAGIHSDHESTTAREAEEKLAAGLHIMIREGTTEKNLTELARIVTPANSHRCFFCSDDRSARDLVRHGHMDDILRRAVAAGIPPITALQMATSNAPYYFRLKRRKGAVAVGYAADLVVFDDLRRFRARMVFKGGRLVARDGELIAACRPKAAPKQTAAMRVKGLSVERLGIRCARPRVNARAIRVIPGQIITREEAVAMRPRGGEILADPSRDILKLALFERHHATGRAGVGLVRGFGLKRGALASTICHDAHNLIVVGADDGDMIAAAEALVKCGGGLAAAEGGRITALLPLPIAGLMSDMGALDVAEAYARVGKAASKLGSALPEPFLSLSFLGLSVIPKLRLTDRGLLDVSRGRLVPLFL